MTLTGTGSAPFVLAWVYSVFWPNHAWPKASQTESALSATSSAKNQFGTSTFHVEGCHRTEHSGVLVVLHGKGGQTQLSSLAKRFKLLACSRNLAVIAPAASSVNQNWPFERAGGDKQDMFLNELLKNELPQRIKLKKNFETHFVGISAGATFLMGDFYPRHAHRYVGSAIALCGGSWPTDQSKLKEKTNFNKLPLAIRISSKDFLFQQSEAGIRAYKAEGIPILQRITHEQGHCNFSLTEATNELLTELIPVRH